MCCGVSALDRFAADVASVPSVRAVVLLEGVNDIGFAQDSGALTAPHTRVSAAQIVGGYRRLIAKAHAAGLQVFGGTLTPFRGAQLWTPPARPSARR
jgi:hypothetical protein